ncbi:hypothetical protein RND81_13G064200 [Saponaria officinalis]|uniref:Reverse transcriptase zinc-binding domain-containing protein n=1 Tax=Saponaria officinalis TaxID=3572 RepID=A0AAW1GUE6_SAPOF
MKATTSWVWSDILCLRDEFLLLCGGPVVACRLLMDWSGPGAQKFNLKAAYDFFRAGAPCAKKIMVLWEPFALPKYSILVNRCYLCHSEESHSHLFFQCSFMRLLWRDMMLWIGITRRPRNLRRELEWVYSHCKGKELLSRLERTIFVAIIYHGWIERNYRVFRNLERDVPTICKQIQFEIMCRYYGRVM